MRQDRPDNVRVVRDAQLVRHGQQQRIGFRDCLVLPELLDEYMWLGHIAAAAHRKSLIANIRSDGPLDRSRLLDQLNEEIALVKPGLEKLRRTK